MEYLAWFLVYLFIGGLALCGRRDDKNVFGIYIEDKQLNVGDLWCALILLYCAYNAVFSLIIFVKV